MTIAVLGAGTGGLAATVELTRAGHDVTLWNRSPARLAPHADGIRFTGVLGEGTASPTGGLTSDLGAALSGAEAVVVCLPSAVHPQLFAELAQHGCAAPVILNPGHTGGALHLRQVFTEHGAPVPPVAEFSTLTYVGRVRDGVANVSGRAGSVRAGALPGGEAALDWAQHLFPGAAPVPDVLASSLSNINLVLHPPGAMLGAAWVEATSGAFTFYVEGMTDGVARVVEQLDRERLTVAQAFGHTLPTLVQEMAAVGTVEPEDADSGTAAAIRGGKANRTIPAPDSLQHRYYREDFAFGLRPFVALASIAGVTVPAAASLLELATVLVPETADGLDARRLGIDGMSRQQLLASITG